MKCARARGLMHTQKPGNNKRQNSACRLRRILRDSTAETHCAKCATNLAFTSRRVALTPRAASLRSELTGRTRSHRNHCTKTGPGCTTHLHSFRRSHLTTCSNLGQVLSVGGAVVGVG